MLAEDPEQSIIMSKDPTLKMHIINNAMADIVFKHDFHGNPSSMLTEIHTKRDTILESMNSRYQYIVGLPKGYLNPLKQHGFIPWRLHDTHFHPALDDYIKCPCTSLAEISELLEKIMEGMDQ